MATLKELRDARLAKLEKLRELGVDPYPARSNRSAPAGVVTANFAIWESKEITVSGRLISIRRHGLLTFMDLKDASGKIQLYIKEGDLSQVNHKHSELSFDDLELLDSGDFLEGSGRVVKTKSGEISVEVSKIRLLA